MAARESKLHISILLRLFSDCFLRHLPRVHVLSNVGKTSAGASVPPGGFTSASTNRSRDATVVAFSRLPCRQRAGVIRESALQFS